MSYPGLGKANYHDARFGPIALWQLNDVLTDSVSGMTLSVEAGTSVYNDLCPGIRGFWFDSLTNLVRSTSESRLQLSGDMTLELLAVPTFFSTAVVQTFVSHDATGETSSSNYLYNLSTQTDRTFSYLAETGSGTDVFYNPLGKVVSLNIPQHLAMVRRSSQVSFYQNGRILSTSVGLSAPSDGTGGKFRVGTDAAFTTRFSGMISSIKLIPNAISSAQVAEDFNVTLGGIYGYI